MGSLENKIWQVWQINLTNLTNLSDNSILVPNFRRIFVRTNLFPCSHLWSLSCFPFCVFLLPGAFFFCVCPILFPCSVIHGLHVGRSFYIGLFPEYFVCFVLIGVAIRSNLSATALSICCLSLTYTLLLRLILRLILRSFRLIVHCDKILILCLFKDLKGCQ